MDSGSVHLRPRLAMQPVRDRPSPAPDQPVPVYQRRGLPPLRGTPVRSSSWMSTGSSRTRRRPSAAGPSLPGTHPPTGDCSRTCWAVCTVWASRSTSPSANLAPSRSRSIFDGHPDAGFSGLKGFFDRLERKGSRLPVQVFLSRYRRHGPCPGCHGARLRPEALAVRIEGVNIAEFSALRSAKPAGGWRAGRPCTPAKSPSGSSTRSGSGSITWARSVWTTSRSIAPAARSPAASCAG